MHSLLNEILKDIRSGKNIDVYILVLLNICLAVLSLINIISLQILGVALFASLSWIMINALRGRKENREQTSLILRKLESVQAKARAEGFLSENYVYNSEDFRKSFQMAQEIFVLGMGQNRMITAYGGQIRRILEGGGKACFMVLDPHGHAIKMSAKRGSTQQGWTVVKNEHLGAIARLASISRNQSCKGILEVRLIDFLSPYTLYGFDWSDPHKASLYVWITPFKEPSEKRPGFKLTKSQDSLWFDFFRAQFDKMWNWDEIATYDLGQETPL